MKIKNQKSKSHLPSIIKGGLTVLISVLVIFTVVKAGSITPPSGTPTAQFYTLSEIYTRLTTNATTTEGGHSFTFSDTATGTGRTLTEIYGVIPTILDNTVKLGTTYLGVTGTLVPSGGDAAAADVLIDKTFFGASQTNWNTQTGSMTNVGQQIITASTSNLTITAGYHDGTGYTFGDADLAAGNIKSGVNIFGVDGNYSLAYTWTKVGAGSWEGVNENLDWAKEIGGTGWWSSITYSYCTSTVCTTSASTTSGTYTGPPGGWNGSNDYTNFNNCGLHNYEIATTTIDLGDCTAYAGDLIFPDGSVWAKSPASGGAYSATTTGCGVNDSNAAAIWSAAGGSGSQYAYARNAPSALSIADAWDGEKNLISADDADVTNRHCYSQNGKNDDYYDRPEVSWYYNTGDGVGTSRLPMIEEYERARQGTSDTATSLLYGTTNWSQYNWSTEQYPTNAYYARFFDPNNGYAYYGSVNFQTLRLWVVVAQ